MPKNWQNTVSDWKDAYLRELRKRKPESIDEVLLPVKKKGCPLSIKPEYDEQVQSYILDLRKGHCTVNTSIVLSAGERIVAGHGGDRSDVTRECKRSYETYGFQ